jgi:hypothetical protein
MTKKNQQPKDHACQADAAQKSETTEDVKAWASRLIENPVHEFDEGELTILKSQVAAVGATPTARETPPDPTRPTIVRSKKALADLASAVEKADEVVVDLETSSLDHRSGVIVGIGLAFDGRTAYIPIHHRFEESQELRPHQMSLIEVAEALDRGCGGPGTPGEAFDRAQRQI